MCVEKRLHISPWRGSWPGPLCSIHIGISNSRIMPFLSLISCADYVHCTRSRKVYDTFPRTRGFKIWPQKFVVHWYEISDCHSQCQKLRKNKFTIMQASKQHFLFLSNFLGWEETNNDNKCLAGAAVVWLQVNVDSWGLWRSGKALCSLGRNMATRHCTLQQVMIQWFQCLKNPKTLNESEKCTT